MLLFGSFVPNKCFICGQLLGVYESQKEETRKKLSSTKSTQHRNKKLSSPTKKQSRMGAAELG
jgi:hypothetical protein